MNTSMVSVVIPSAGSPGHVRRAVHSVLRQSYQNLECIVSLDGPQVESRQALEHIADRRLHITHSAERKGAPAARNAGIRQAQGRYIAFLDDDDEWLSNKVERQVRALNETDSLAGPIVVSCQFSTGRGQTQTAPRLIPSQQVPIAEYIFDRSEIRWSARQLQTSTLLVERTNCLYFDEALPRHQDWDWIVRMSQNNARVVIVPEVLSHWHVDAGKRISSRKLTDSSLEWARYTKKALSRRAYSSLLLSYLAPAAAKDRNFRLFARIGKEAIANGAIRWQNIVTAIVAFRPRRRR
jgi:glycosyltransferase involved in cell wall biosynthesis